MNFSWRKIRITDLVSEFPVILVFCGEKVEQASEIGQYLLLINGNAALKVIGIKGQSKLAQTKTCLTSSTFYTIGRVRHYFQYMISEVVLFSGISHMAISLRQRTLIFHSATPALSSLTAIRLDLLLWQENLKICQTFTTTLTPLHSTTRNPLLLHGHIF